MTAMTDSLHLFMFEKRGMRGGERGRGRGIYRHLRYVNLLSFLSCSSFTSSLNILWDDSKVCYLSSSVILCYFNWLLETNSPVCNDPPEHWPARPEDDHDDDFQIPRGFVRWVLTLRNPVILTRYAHRDVVDDAARGTP
jgi:hypothetical protein